MSHEAIAGHEMTDMPQQRDYAQLLDSENRVNAKRSQGTWPRFRDSLRLFRLQFVSLIFGSLTRWKSNTEFRKVAMYRSRRVATSHSLLHLVPLSGAITGLTLQWSKYWVGTDTNDTTVLQFVAKFHELTMQASLVEALLGIIRAEAVNGYVPLGALSGATQPTQLSYLWSLDFISMAKSPALHRWRRALLLLTIPIIVILTSLVGPSTAILMIPRPNTPHIVEEVTLYALNSTEAIFPSRLTQSNGLGVDLQQYNITKQDRRNVEARFSNETSTVWAESTVYDTDRYGNDKCNSQRTMRCIVEADPSGNFSFATATLPTCFTSRGYSYSDLAEDWLNRTVSVVAPHPVVSTRCQNSQYLELDVNNDTETGSSTKISYFYDNGTAKGILFDYQTLSNRVSNLTAANDSIARDSYYPPIWTRSPEYGSNSLIGVFPSYIAGDLLRSPLAISSAMTCTVLAYWHVGEVQFIVNRGIGAVYTGMLPMSETRNVRSISLDVVDVVAMQSSEFHRDLVDMGDPDISAKLAELLAISISAVPKSSTTRAKDVQGDKDRYKSSFKFITIVNGYGYGNISTSIRLAMAVMTTYCVVSVAYVAYILITGSTSTAWNSGIELVALALQSKKPDHLGNSGVGIDSIKTYQEGVGIRVNQENELELVFANDRDIEKRGLRKLERNVEY